MAIKTYEVEEYADLNEYYAAYPEYYDAEDVEKYPQLDPRISLAQLSFHNSVSADLERV